MDHIEAKCALFNLINGTRPKVTPTIARRILRVGISTAGLLGKVHAIEGTFPLKVPKLLIRINHI